MSKCLGIKNPSERTVGNWLALLILLHYKDQAFPSYAMIFQHLGSLKTAIKGCGKKFKLPLRSSYPKLPTQLDEKTMKVYFPPKSPPAYVDMPRFEVVAKCHIPLRRNSKLLKEEKARTSQLAAQSSLQQPQQVAAAATSNNQGDAPLPLWAQEMKRDNELSKRLHEENMQLKQALANKQKKKKPRLALRSKAEAHCACVATIMVRNGPSSFKCCWASSSRDHWSSSLCLGI